MSFKMSSIPCRQPNVPLAISLQGDIIVSSHHCLALMSNWDISGCLPYNVILFCILDTLEDKTLYRNMEENEGE